MSHVVSQARPQRCVLHIAPVLAEDVKNQLLALEQNNLLKRAVSLFNYCEGGIVHRMLSWVDWLFGCRLQRRSASRRLPWVIARRCVVAWVVELLYRLREVLGGQGASPRITDYLLRSVDRLGASEVKGGLRLTIGREDACMASFASSHALSAGCLYDLPTCHYSVIRAIMEGEEREFPYASHNYSFGQEYDEQRNRRKNRELAQADHVLVASQFVRRGLIDAGFASSRISVIPYGCEPRAIYPSIVEGRLKNKVILYVGNLSLRKGVPRLLRAWKRLGAYRTYRLRLIGSCQLSRRFMSEYADYIEHIPRMARSELWNHYLSASAFVFPSVGDGFGLVMNEALSCGLPVIASENSGAPGFITHGHEGLLYAYDDEDALCAALDQLLSRPSVATEMGGAAYQLAQRWTWQHYRRAFIGLVRRLVDQQMQTECLKLEAGAACLSWKV
jgi:alpha-maltose-1-phosphate synthase